MCMGKFWYRRLCESALFVVLLAASSVNAQSRYSISQDGTEVYDNQTALVWRRCSEGQTYNSDACTGEASPFLLHESALVHASSQVGWRLPNIKELASIVDYGRESPSIDADAFPNTPTSYYWTSTPYAHYSGLVWVVYFFQGDIMRARRSPGYPAGAVRLVKQTPFGGRNEAR